MSTSPRFTNHLVNATSPYLLQHQYNPVDWYQWGDEALEKARQESKPIFLSIGYAACHWCHVMEHESFENEAIGEFLNDHFISIKVDREERPDLDEIYMTAVQMMTGSGGWPMTVFLTPDLKPFYGGTYFPPEDRWGRPGFGTLISRIAEIWESERDDILHSASQLTKAIVNSSQTLPALSNTSESGPDQRILDLAFEHLQKSYDAKYGGFGSAPKFPPSQVIQFLLRYHHHTGSKVALEMATNTLAKMADGGMYDQLGGGFHRYSVDEKWLVPHFEKMLYDNALLIPAYVEAWQVTRDSSFKCVVDETLQYIHAQMTSKLGGFFSTEDADSEGEEGKFYIWLYSEIQDILGKDDAEVFCAYYGVKPEGNFSSHETYHLHQNILHHRVSAKLFAAFISTRPIPLFLYSDLTYKS